MCARGGKRIQIIQINDLYSEENVFVISFFVSHFLISFIRISYSFPPTQTNRVT